MQTSIEGFVQPVTIVTVVSQPYYASLFVMNILLSDILITLPIKPGGAANKKASYVTIVQPHGFCPIQ